MAAFYNTATLSYRDTSTNSNTVEGQLVQVLAAEKTAVLPTYGSSNTVTYIVSIRNSGAAAYTGLTVTDDLGGYAFAGRPGCPSPMWRAHSSITATARCSPPRRSPQAPRW